MTTHTLPDTSNHADTPNRIGALEFHFDASEASHQLGAPEKLLMAVRAELLEIVDSTLAEVARDSTDIRLEHIDVDLGAFPDPPDWQQVRRNLRQRLLSELAPYLRPASAKPGVTRQKKHWGAQKAKANLPTAPDKPATADPIDTSVLSDETVLQIFGTTGRMEAEVEQEPMSDTARLEFKTTRRAPDHAAASTRKGSDETGPSRQQHAHSTGSIQTERGSRQFPHAQQSRLFRSIRPTAAGVAGNGPPSDKIAAQVGDVADGLRALTGEPPDGDAINGFIAQLRWRRLHAPRRLHDELIRLSQPDLLNLSKLTRASTGPEPTPPTNQLAQIQDDSVSSNGDWITRIERALEGTEPPAPDLHRAEELAAVLRRLSSDTDETNFAPARLVDVANKALISLSLAEATEAAAVPVSSQEETPATDGAWSSTPNLSRMTGAELRILICTLLPKNATALSDAIDRLDDTSADPNEARRVVAQALIKGTPIDLESARRATADTSSSKDAADIALAALLRKLGASERAIAAFFEQRFGPLAMPERVSTNSARSKTQAKLSTEANQTPAEKNSLTEALGTSGAASEPYADVGPPTTSTPTERASHTDRTRLNAQPGGPKSPMQEERQRDLSEDGTRTEDAAHQDLSSDHADHTDRTGDSKVESFQGAEQTSSVVPPPETPRQPAAPDSVGATDPSVPARGQPYGISDRDAAPGHSSDPKSGEAGKVSPYSSDALAPDDRLNALFEAATDAPRLREMFELIWSAMSDGATPAWRDRARYWQAALAAALATQKGRSAKENTVETFLSVVEPDDSARHTILRVLLARLGYGQPGTDPALRRETRYVLENLLATDRTLPATITQPDTDANFVATARAGLVIFHPYLPMLFDRMAVLTPENLVRPGQLSRAAAALAVLAEDTPRPRPADPLERLLLGAPNTAEIGFETLKDSDINLIDSLLRSVIGQWPRLGQTSPAGLRHAFIRRAGVLEAEGDAPRLLVSEGPYDMLLDGLPWALSPVALNWMTAPLTVIWRSSDD